MSAGRLLGVAALALALTLSGAAPAAAGSPRTGGEELERARVRIGLQIVQVEVARTEAQKRQGLSGRTHLPEGHGMWFPYRTPARHSFWMKGMRIPLDFVWVRRGVIVGLHQDVSPAGGSDTLVRPPEPADAVLEVPAGTVARWGWRVGDAVELTPLPE